MDGICTDLGGVVIVGRGQHLERKARRDAVHSLIDPGGIPVFLHAARFRVGLLEAFAVIDPHFRKDRRVLVLAQARHDRESRERLERGRRAGDGSELGAVDQLGVDLLLLGRPEAIRHLDDADPVDESFVVLVGLEALPFRFVRMREDDARKRDRAYILGADIVALLRRCEQRMQHLDRRLEHLDEFEDALVGAIQAAGIAVRIGIVLGERLQLADVDLADQRGNILIVFVPRLGLRNSDLTQSRRLDFRNPKP